MRYKRDGLPLTSDLYISSTGISRANMGAHNMIDEIGMRQFPANAILLALSVCQEIDSRDPNHTGN